MINDENRTSLNKRILAALDADNKKVLQKIMQELQDNEHQCIEIEHQQFIKELVQKYDGHLKLQSAEIENNLYQKYLDLSKDLVTALGKNYEVFMKGYSERYELNEKDKDKPHYKIVRKKLEKELESFFDNHESIFTEANEKIKCLTIDAMKDFTEDEQYIAKLEKERQEHIHKTKQEWDAKRKKRVEDFKEQFLNKTSQINEFITPFFIPPKNEFTKKNDEESSLDDILPNRATVSKKSAITISSIIALFIICIPVGIYIIFEHSLLGYPSNDINRDYDTASQKTETDIFLTFIGPQGVNAKLYYDESFMSKIFMSEKFIGTVETGKVFRTSIPNSGRFTFETQMGILGSEKFLSFAPRHSTTVEIRLSAKKRSLLPGVVFSEFSLVNRVPAIVRYVSVDGLNVRSRPNPFARKLDTISQDCRVEVLEKYTNSWLKIKYYNNKIGYVKGKYITAKQDKKSIAKQEASYTNNKTADIEAINRKRFEDPLIGTNWEYVNPDDSNNRYKLFFSENSSVIFSIYNNSGSIRLESYIGSYSLQDNNLSLNVGGDTSYFFFSSSIITNKHKKSIVYKRQ